MEESIEPWWLGTAGLHKEEEEEKEEEKEGFGVHPSTSPSLLLSLCHPLPPPLLSPHMGFAFG